MVALSFLLEKVMGRMRITILLEPKEAKALVQASSAEVRQPREQARYMLLTELIRRGLLPQQEQPEQETADVCDKS
jgi:hypothetical protein